MGNTATALVRVEDSPVALAIDARSAALLELLPDAAAATRFKRVVIQALAKNPDLLLCTPDSVVTSVFEAAAMGLEPTGAVGGAHLVPFNVNVGTQQNPRWEKRAQLIPDYRGVVRMVTRADPRTGRPSDVVSVEARVVKEGDEFAYTQGTDTPEIQHVPALSATRSSKPTTHVYAVARLRSGGTQSDVEDRAGIERIRQRGKKKGISPWDTDWDEMAKKTIVKRLAKLLPVTPEVRGILAREDDTPEEAVVEPGVPAAVRGPRTAALAARLRPQPSLPPDPDPEPEAETAAFVEMGDEHAADAPPAAMTVAELKDWMADHKVAGEYAGEVAKKLWPGTKTAADLTDEQRAVLVAELEKGS